jgi:ADP-ribose pyrophosphatase YjhB (NUDIX family)
MVDFVRKLTGDGSLLMVENYRHGVGQQLLELPGGFINPGEIPTHAAGRELLEETGYAACVLKEISSHYTWPGRCMQFPTLRCSKNLLVLLVLLWHPEK